MGLRADNLKVHIIIAAWAWGSYLGTEGLEKGIRVKTSSFTRHHVNITMCKAKANGNYMNSMLALQDALSAGYDEALLLDVDGYVAEGSGEKMNKIAFSLERCRKSDESRSHAAWRSKTKTIANSDSSDIASSAEDTKDFEKYKMIFQPVKLYLM